MKLPWDTKTLKTSYRISGKSGLVRKVLSLFTAIPSRTLMLTIPQDPENLLVMVQTWQNGDVSMQEPYNGDFEKAMASIKAKTLVLPAKTDLYFP